MHSLTFFYHVDVIGAIDGCHIAIKAPEEQQDSYLNRKFFHSINLQGVCTNTKIFLNAFIGFPGSAHDARVNYLCSLQRTEFSTMNYLLGFEVLKFVQKLGI